MLPSDFSPEKQARQRFLKREADLREAKRPITPVGRDGWWDFNVQFDRAAGDLNAGPGGTVGFATRLMQNVQAINWEVELIRDILRVRVPARSQAAARKLLDKEIVRAS